ncbi:SOS response associated peptidase (SRAP) [Panacagrimonas perspica]|uniref:SOS response associated peptidase (SRAP) n=2 Tax=Panacagrimonas perspica TaxID=381431 RepID=A0A4R7PGN6_9GAMM|nr:SOS response associated peptidase (SRAP) [Panacagrimonas perspica]
MVKQRYSEYVRVFGARVDIDEFARLYVFRSQGGAVKIPKGMDANFDEPGTDGERAIKSLIQTYNKSNSEKWEQEIFKQRRRLADAERALHAKPTKKAANDKRIATNRIEQMLGWLDDLKRTEPKSRDSRIFSKSYCPVMVFENGHRVVKPMRYLCRPAGMPASFDEKYPGCFNARRDNLEGFWKNQFGQTHGIVLATSFFENVSRHRLEDRELRHGESEENVRIEFRPQTGGVMHAACLWSRWIGPDGSELLSFAAITDEPPAEVAATGHDRCIIPIDPGNIDAWLDPNGDLVKSYAILDARERPYYEHRLAA